LRIDSKLMIENLLKS